MAFECRLPQGHRASGPFGKFGNTTRSHSRHSCVKKFDVDPAMPAFFRLALTTMAVKSLLPNFPHNPLELECTRLIAYSDLVQLLI